MASSGLSLEQLALFGEEVAALARAGIPLPAGLKQAAAQTPGRLGHTMRQLAEELERGVPLERAILQLDTPLPPELAAVMAAGSRSGNLAAALEGLVEVAQVREQLRRTVLLAMVYPGVVLLGSWCVLGIISRLTLPAIASGYQTMRLEPSAPVQWFFLLMQIPLWVWFSLPLILLAGWAIWVWASHRALDSPSLASLLFGWVPGARGLRADAAATAFASMLAQLIRFQVPLPEALRLAARVSNSPRLQRGGYQLAGEVARGSALSKQTLDAAGFPAFLKWMFIAGLTQSRLDQTLQDAALHYRKRVLERGNVLRTVLPVMIVLLVGGLVAVLCTMAVWGPWLDFLNQLGRDVLEIDGPLQP